jgi:ATP-binding cassette subfamily F protein uup
VSPAKAGRVKQRRTPAQGGCSPAALRRLNFNDRRALDVLPARIAALETQIAELNAVLADPDLYARDPARFGATTAALAVARAELATAEEQWLRLELLREEIEVAEPRY